MQLKEISSFKPEHRILNLIDYLKKEEGIPTDQKFEVSLTRQHIADSYRIKGRNSNPLSKNSRKRRKFGYSGT